MTDIIIEKIKQNQKNNKKTIIHIEQNTIIIHPNQNITSNTNYLIIKNNKKEIEYLINKNKIITIK